MTLSFRITLIFLCSAIVCYSQNQAPTGCGQKEITEKLFQENPSIRNLQQSIEEQVREYNIKVKSGELQPQQLNAVVTLPVVVHIIHNNGTENISDVQVQAAIQHLNEAFANTGYYNPADGVNMEIQFCLAQRDPAGKPTNGITRDVSPYTIMSGGVSDDDQNVKNINRWNPRCYINIWVVRSIPGSVVGYAYYPSAHGLSMDGIVVEANYFGSSYRNDVVVIHEMGHYLGLAHTFEGGCKNDDCTTDGDKVCDTPPDQSTAYIGCNSTMNSCSTDALSGFATDVNDLHQNYLDYGNFDCMKVFTQGQKDRAKYFIQNVRKSLLDCKSCQSPCPSPVTANFTSPGTTVAAGTSYTFTNSSVNATSYEWYVNGVLYGVSSGFSHNFPTTGTYIIKLVAKTNNPLCEDKFKSDTIVAVCPVTAAFTKSAATAVAGTNINFSNTSTGASSYQWFVNGALQSTGTHFSYTSNTAGIYIIKLVSHNTSVNCTREITDTVEFTCPVIADFTPLTTTVTVGATVNFINSSIAATGYEWLNNGTVVSSSLNYSFTPVTGGNYVIQLKAGNGVCSSLQTAYVVVTDTIDPCSPKRFQKTYGGAGDDEAYDLVHTADKGYIIAGRSNSAGAGAYDALILKISAAGTIEWEKYVGGPQNDNFRKIKQTADGGYIAIGATNSFAHVKGDILLSKFSATGTVLWSKQFGSGTTNGEYGSNVVSSLDGSFYFVGITNNSMVVSNILVGKTDANGNLIWTKSYDHAGMTDMGFGILEEGDSLVISGYSTGTGTHDGLLMKMHKNNGNVGWSKKYDLNGNNNGMYDVEKLNNEYHFLTHSGTTPSSGDEKQVVLVTDISGNVIKKRMLTAPVVGGYQTMHPTGDGGHIIGQSEISASADVHLVKLNAAGNVDWTNRLVQPGFQKINRLIQTTDAAFAGIGVSKPSANSNGDIYLFKTDASGKTSDSCINLNTTATVTNVTITISTPSPVIATPSMTLPNITPVIKNGISSVAILCEDTPCVLPPVDSCAICNQLTLIKKDTVCSFRNAVEFKAVKNINCSVAVNWVYDNSFVTLVSSTDSTIWFQFKKTGKFALKAILNTGCKLLEDSIIVNVFNSPDSINLGPDIQICKISTYTLKAGSGFKSYLWNDGTTDSVLTVYNPGQYHVTATDYCGGLHRDTVNIILAPDVPFDLGPNISICKGDSITITAPGSFSNYTWSSNYNISSIYGKSVQVWPVTDTSYTVVAVVSPGCLVIDTLRVTVHTALRFNIGNDTSFCKGDSALLRGPSGFTNYTWQDGTAGETYIARAAGKYWLRFKDNNGCNSSDTVEITKVHALPYVELGNDGTICLNTTKTFDAGPGSHVYNWHDGSTNRTFTTDRIGKYWVNVTDSNRCTISDTVQITGIDNLPAGFLDKTSEICKNKSVELKAIGNWNTYAWFNNARTASVTVTSPGDYWLEVTNGAGCIARDTITVIPKNNCLRGIHFPNAFTPNNDGKNDTYKPVAGDLLQKFHITIYNRWGEKVFDSKNPNKGWDGTYKGKLFDTATFVWYCSYQFAGVDEKGQTAKGTLILIR